MLRTYLKVILCLLVLTTIIQARSKSFSSYLRSCNKWKCNSPDGSYYDIATLSLSWPGQFCSGNNCIDSWSSDWSGKSFGIHGYWPSNGDEKLTCLKGSCPDPNCNYPDQFKLNTSIKISDEPSLADLVQDLSIYWPEYGKGNRYKFRQNEWNKHGVCYLKVQKERFKDTRSQSEIRRYYFTSTLEKAKSIPKLTRFRYNSKQELGRELGIEDLNKFYITCSGYKKDDTTSQQFRNKYMQKDSSYNNIPYPQPENPCYLSELRICYDLAPLGQEKLTNCYGFDLNQPSNNIVPIILEQAASQDDASDERKVLLMSSASSQTSQQNDQVQSQKDEGSTEQDSEQYHQTESQDNL